LCLLSVTKALDSMHTNSFVHREEQPVVISAQVVAVLLVEKVTVLLAS
jgi:hypothetical protein